MPAKVCKHEAQIIASLAFMSVLEEAATNLVNQVAANPSKLATALVIHSNMVTAEQSAKALILMHREVAHDLGQEHAKTQQEYAAGLFDAMYKAMTTYLDRPTEDGPFITDKPGPTEFQN